MRSVFEALRCLRAEGEVIRGRAVQPVVDGQRACHELERTLCKLRENGAALRMSRPKLNPQHVWSTFAAGRFQVSAVNDLEFRTLCTAEETALRPELISALMRSPERLRRSRCLHGLVHHYFLQWRTMQGPSAVEILLRSAFARYPGSNAVGRKWSENPSLFSADAADFLAAKVCTTFEGVDNVLKAYFISPLTQLACELRASAATAAGRRFRQLEQAQGEDWSLGYLSWLIDRVLSDLTPTEAFCEVAGLLILSKSAGRSQVFRQTLSSYIQHHKKLGDPRLRETSPNWRYMLPEASQRYLSWLARDSIIFFFNTILPDTNENRRRKEFWLQYYGSIRDFQVAVSREDVWKIRSGQQSTELMAYSQVEHPTTSAFLMQFEGYGTKFVIVEFSETGNAAYIFKLADFESLGVTLRSPNFDRNKHLKNERKIDRIVHNGDWETKASHMLAYSFGIRP